MKYIFVCFQSVGNWYRWWNLDNKWVKIKWLLGSGLLERWHGNCIGRNIVTFWDSWYDKQLMGDGTNGIQWSRKIFKDKIHVEKYICIILGFNSLTHLIWVHSTEYNQQLIIDSIKCLFIEIMQHLVTRQDLILNWSTSAPTNTLPLTIINNYSAPRLYQLTSQMTKKESQHDSLNNSPWQLAEMGGRAKD